MTLIYSLHKIDGVCLCFYDDKVNFYFSTANKIMKKVGNIPQKLI